MTITIFWLFTGLLAYILILNRVKKSLLKHIMFAFISSLLGLLSMLYVIILIAEEDRKIMRDYYLNEDNDE